MVRPMIYASEDDIILAASKHNLPIVQSPCPANGKTQREYMKKLLKGINEEIPGASDRVINALQNKQQLSIWDK